MIEISPQDLCGWQGTEKAQEYYQKFGSHFAEFKIVGSASASKKTFLYQVNRKVLGKDTPNYPQEIGDCVSFGAKNAIEYLQCCETLMNGENVEFKYIFPPYLYGTGREEGGMLGGGDGSYGSAQADAVKKWGAIASDTPGLPKYSGSVAKEYGRRSAPKEFKEIGKLHLIKSIAPCRTWDDFCTAIGNGYLVTIASDVGYTMEPRSDGFHVRSGSWAHQMCGIGFDNEYKTPYGLILNSWGDCHGHLKDFETGEDLPVGVLRVRAEDIERMLKQKDSWIFGQYEEYPGQNINEKLFDLMGD